jgi:NTE family protein
MLEALDELGITPHRIAGCSIGAVIGALYASGMTAVEIRDAVHRISMSRGERARGAFSDRTTVRWVSMIDPDFGRSGLLKSEAVMAALCRDAGCETFEELVIPFMVVATDFWERRTVVFDSGPLKPAVQASMALPGLFAPVELDGRVLVDGGTTNPVPYDLLEDSCDVVVAIDINSGSPGERGSVPGYFYNVFGSIQILQQAILAQELEAHPPDIYIRPDLREFRTLHFLKAEEIYREAQPAKEQLKQQLHEAVASWEPK